MPKIKHQDRFKHYFVQILYIIYAWILNSTTRIQKPAYKYSYLWKRLEEIFLMKHVNFCTNTFIASLSCISVMLHNMPVKAFHSDYGVHYLSSCAECNTSAIPFRWCRGVLVCWWKHSRWVEHISEDALQRASIRNIPDIMYFHDVILGYIRSFRFVWFAK